MLQSDTARGMAAGLAASVVLSLFLLLQQYGWAS
jgi:hypothetical protein